MSFVLKYNNTPSDYNNFFLECAKSDTLAYPTDEYTQKLSIEHKLKIQASTIENAIKSSFTGSREIHMFARWMREDKTLDNLKGLKKTKEFVREFFEKNDPSLNLFEAISALPEENFNECILETRAIVMKLSKEVSEQNTRRDVLNRLSAIETANGYTAKQLLKNTPKISLNF